VGPAAAAPLGFRAENPLVTGHETQLGGRLRNGRRVPAERLLHDKRNVLNHEGLLKGVGVAGSLATRTAVPQALTYLGRPVPTPASALGA
jgi:hypothetical protein